MLSSDFHITLDCLSILKPRAKRKHRQCRCFRFSALCMLTQLPNLGLNALYIQKRVRPLALIPQQRRRMVNGGHLHAAGQGRRPHADRGPHAAGRQAEIPYAHPAVRQGARAGVRTAQAHQNRGQTPRFQSGDKVRFRDVDDAARQRACNNICGANISKPGTGSPVFPLAEKKLRNGQENAPAGHIAE